MTTFVSLYQRFQEIGDFSTWKKESEAKKKREREREKSKETWAYTACYFR